MQDRVLVGDGWPLREGGQVVTYVDLGMSACLAGCFGVLGIAAYAMGTDQNRATALDPFECVNPTFKRTPTTHTEFGSDRVGGVAGIEAVC